MEITYFPHNCVMLCVCSPAELFELDRTWTGEAGKQLIAKRHELLKAGREFTIRFARDDGKKNPSMHESALQALTC